MIKMAINDTVLFAVYVQITTITLCLAFSYIVSVVQQLDLKQLSISLINRKVSNYFVN